MALRKLRGSNKSKGLCKLAIEEDMTIYAVKAIKNDLSEELDSYNRFELDLSKVEEIDSAGIQLLLALQGELVRKNKQFTLTEVNGTVTKLFETYNLGDHFAPGAAS